jgi:ubiquinone/menaquinone biosynthesis C-methylase UbiE
MSDLKVKNWWKDGLWTSKYFAGIKEKNFSYETKYLIDPPKLRWTQIFFTEYEKVRKVPINENSKILEVGCSVGRNLRAAHQVYGCNVVGIDINNECLERCRSVFGERGEFYEADLRDASFFSRFKDNEFDIGITCQFLMHIGTGPEKEKLIQEIVRVCKETIFLEVNPDSTHRRDTNDMCMKNGEDHYRAYEQKELHPDDLSLKMYGGEDFLYESMVVSGDDLTKADSRIKVHMNLEEKYGNCAQMLMYLCQKNLDE